MTHAVINDNSNVRRRHLLASSSSLNLTFPDASPLLDVCGWQPDAPTRTACTDNFQALPNTCTPGPNAGMFIQPSRSACLNTPGAQNSYLYHEVEIGAEFYMDENDYIAKNDAAKILEAKHKVKVETTPNMLPSSSSSTPAPVTTRGKKRPRRSAAVTVRSYAVPDSDDEAITDEDSRFWIDNQKCKETNLQIWIKHLSDLLKCETRKVRHYPAPSFSTLSSLLFNSTPR